jgi:hypothetical protein
MQRATVEQDEGIVKTRQGLIDGVLVNLAYCRINAALTGRVGLRLVDAGNSVHAADTNGLIVITQIDPNSVLFTVAEDQLPPVLETVWSRESIEPKRVIFAHRPCPRRSKPCFGLRSRPLESCGKSNSANSRRSGARESFTRAS